MKPDLNDPVSAVHRLLFQALLEIREQGHESGNKVVFHLADLFHNVVLEMEAAARSRMRTCFRRSREPPRRKG